MSYVGQCAYEKCMLGGEVSSSDITMRRLADGFVESRRQGGANKVVKMELVPNVIWHKLCWEAWQRDLSGQSPLF